LCPLNFVIGFFGYFAAYFGGATQGIVMLSAFIVNLLVLLPVAWLVLKEKNRSLRSLLWFVVPSGVIVLFAFLGYTTLEALDRAYPSF
jgi:uncharacterized protein with PQ loop repeat